MSYDFAARLDEIFANSTSIPVTGAAPIVIFSDLHLGDGKRGDDFARNGDMFLSILERYYMQSGFRLILNGDVEELQKYSLAKIRRRWPRFYELMGALDDEGRLFKVIGNHDLDLEGMAERGCTTELHEGLRLNYRGQTLFVVHGHQASQAFDRYNAILAWLVRYLVRPLGIKNKSVAHDNRRKHKLEEKIYGYAASRGIIAIIGHTHRPLFESMSKTDTLKYNIEHILRHYEEFDAEERRVQKRLVAEYLAELREIKEREEDSLGEGGIYHDLVLKPNLFNSGTVVGRKGMTCLELDNDQIRLVHWFKDANERVRVSYPMNRMNRPLDDGYVRVVIKEDSLDYIFTNIELLEEAR
jgi:predicted phosphodiesterase